MSSFYAPAQLYEPGGLDKVLQSLLHGPAQQEDEYINEVMTNHMFQDGKTGTQVQLFLSLGSKCFSGGGQILPAQASLILSLNVIKK